MKYSYIINHQNVTFVLTIIWQIHNYFNLKMTKYLKIYLKSLTLIEIIEIFIGILSLE